jgi:hypothetical protein
VCGWECSAGYERVGGGCVLRVPRPIAPLSTSMVTSQQPSFRWELPPGVEGVTIEICRDRALTVQCQTVDADGTSGRPARVLERGVWYWSLRGRSGGSVGTLTSAVWQFHVGARSAPVDTSHGSILDVNGDGYADFAVGDSTEYAQPGRVHVFLGSARGPSASASLTLDTPYGLDSSFGSSVASVGDVNGDGYADLAVGADTTMGSTGQVYVYLGSATGLSPTPSITLTAPDGHIGRFGAAVAGAGDVNGDGYADLAVGADEMMDATGRVYLYLGSAAGFGAMPALRVDGPDGRNGHFGASLAGGGDLNGDGYADLVVGAWGALELKGRVHVFLGSVTGLTSTPALSLTGADSSWSYFSTSLASAGDLNGDGYADLVVGAPAALQFTGRVHVYLGSATGPRDTPALSLTGPDGNGTHFGTGVASAGDLNGDGYADLAVGANGQAGSSVWGRVHLYFGSAAGPSATSFHTLTAPGRTAGFGHSLASAGDLNGDGHTDLVVGCLAGAPDIEIGAVRVYLGSATGPGDTPFLSLERPGERTGRFGISLARADAVRRAPARTPVRPRTPALVCRAPSPA